MGAKDLPIASGDEIAKGFEALGWNRRRGGRNHLILTHKDHRGVELAIPDHKEVDRFLLNAQVRNAGLTVAQYVEAFEAVRSHRKPGPQAA